MLLRKIDLNLLILLDVLIDERSVTRTAKRMSISQPALSNALNRLREMLDDPLLERTNEGMEPTPYALSISKPIKRIIHELNDLFAQKADFDPLTTTRCFTLQVEEHIGGLVQPIIQKLKMLAPKATLRMLPFAFRENKPLIDAEADALITFNFRSYSGIAHVPLLVDELVAIVRRGHPHAKEEITLEELANNFDHFLLEHSLAGMGQEYFDGLLGNFGIQREIKLRLSLVHDQMGLIASSNFVGMWPRRNAMQANVLFGEPYAIMELPKTFRDMTKAEIDLFWEERYTDDPCNQWFRQLIRNVCREEFGPLPAEVLEAA